MCEEPVNKVRIADDVLTPDFTLEEPPNKSCNSGQCMSAAENVKKKVCNNSFQVIFMFIPIRICASDISRIMRYFREK